MNTGSQIDSINDITLLRQAMTAVYGLSEIDIHEIVRGVNRTFRLTESGNRTSYLRLYRTHGRSKEDIDNRVAFARGSRAG